MKLSDYKTADGGDVCFVELTAEEQSSMARWVMDCLCLPWVDTYPEFQQILMVILHRGSKGKDISLDQFEELLAKYERFVSKEYKIPRLPRFKTNDSRLMAPRKIRGEDLKGQDAIEWLQKHKALLWYDQWDNHPDMRRKLGMWVFPNHEPDDQYREHQYQLEERFWLEVDRRQAEYECSRRAAIVSVNDTHPRADPDYRLPDPAMDD